MDRPHTGKNQFPELTRSLELSAEGLAASPASLCAEAETLIANYGTDSTVNGLAAKISAEYSLRQDIGDRPLYVRLAKLKKPGAGDELPFIVFAEDDRIPVKTPRLRALRFQEYVGDISLVALNGPNPEPVMNDERYLKLVTEITLDIESKSAEGTEAARARREAQKHRFTKAIAGWFMDKAKPDYSEYFDTVGQRRTVAVASSLIALLLSYGHVPFGNEDVKIGPLPMPQPIELLVDWNNAPDHKAQSFKEPLEAAELRISDDEMPIPVLDAYDTKGVPDASYIDAQYSILKEESRPGLYRVDFAFSTPKPVTEGKETKPTQRNCVTVLGDYHTGVSRVFTQDLTTAQHMRAIVSNTRHLNVCEIEGAPEGLRGSFYVWQDK